MEFSRRSFFSLLVCFGLTLAPNRVGAQDVVEAEPLGSGEVQVESIVSVSGSGSLEDEILSQLGLVAAIGLADRVQLEVGVALMPSQQRGVVSDVATAAKILLGEVDDFAFAAQLGLSTDPSLGVWSTEVLLSSTWSSSHLQLHTNLGVSVDDDQTLGWGARLSGAFLPDQPIGFNGELGLSSGFSSVDSPIRWEALFGFAVRPSSLLELRLAFVGAHEETETALESRVAIGVTFE